MKLKTDGWQARKLQSYLQSYAKIISYQDVIDRLNRDIKEFPKNLSEGLKTNEFLDGDLAYALLEKCERLLLLCSGSLPQEQVPYVLAAIDYFVNKDDGAPDFSSLDGFQDDEAVINAVITQFSINLDAVAVKDKKGA